MSMTPKQDQNSVVAVFSQNSAEEKAIKELKDVGFDIKKIAVVGRDYQTESDVVGFYNTGDRMKYWGKWGAFWGGLWGLLFGSAFLIIPGIGPVVAAGSIVSWIVAGLEGAIVTGGLSALGAGLFSIGIPKNSVVKYETSIKAGKFVLVAHGTAEEVTKARDMLKTSGAEQVELAGFDRCFLLYDAVRGDTNAEEPCTQRTMPSRDDCSLKAGNTPGDN
jgi:hypothetical protein